MVKHAYGFLADGLSGAGAGRRALAAGFILAMLSLAAACGGGGGGGETPAAETPTVETTAAETPTVETPAARGQLSPVVISSDLAVGPNRFLLGLIDQARNEEVLGADLHFRFFKLEGDEAILRSETDATRIEVTKSFTRTRQDGTVETVDIGETGAYVADVEFDSPGDWGVEVSGAIAGEPIEPITVGLAVLEKSLTVAVGDPAPRSVQTILSDVDDISEIDTSDPPNPDMHDMTIADAVTSGTPTVIIFGTPAFCVSRVCGPTKQAVDELYADYKGQANFVHVEPYDLEKARSGEGLEVLPFLEQEWGLQSEPWVFLVDADGNVAAKFEAMVSREEVEEALQEIL